jgi:phosphoglycerate kinase
MKTLDNFSFANEKVLIRVDYNVPLTETFEVRDESRIVATIPTLKKILQDGGAIILMSHLGRPKTGYEEKFSLKHIVNSIKKHTSTEVFFATDCIGNDAKEKAKALKPGQILLLENLRFHKEEAGGDENFAKQLAELGTFYVNDAFGTAHRAHASTAVIAGYFPAKKCFGYVMQGELDNAGKLLQNQKRPFTAIVGGAKVSDKLLIIENLMKVADNIIIGGGMAYTFAKAEGGSIGNSLCEDDRLELCKNLISKAETEKVNLILPEDSIVADNFNNEANTKTALNHEIPDNWMGLDIGPKSIANFTEIIHQSKTILWNGPMGVFEMDKFSKGTKAVAEAIAKATENGAFSLIGGGDSAAAVNKFGYQNKVSYVSTGGGALLEYFEGKTLPGVAAILEDTKTGAIVN